MRYCEKAASLMESDFSSVAMLLDPDNLTLRYNFACGFVELKDTETALQGHDRRCGKAAGG